MCPVFCSSYGRNLFKEKQGLNFFIGFVIAITGVILISLSREKNFHLNPLGDFLAFLAMISWGAYSAIVKKIGEWEYPVIAVTRRIYFYGIILLMPILIGEYVASGRGFVLQAFKNPYVILNFLFLGLFASALGFLLWNLATSWIGAVKTSLYIYVSPIVTVVLSLVILHEKMTVVSVVGAICISCNVTLLSGREIWYDKKDIMFYTVTDNEEDME